VCAVVVFFIWVIFWFLIKRLVYWRIKRFTKATTTKIDDIIIHSLEVPLNLLIFASGILVVQSFSFFAVDGNIIQHLITGFKITIIIAMMMFFDNLAKNSINTYSGIVETLKSYGSVAHGFFRIIIFGLGFLMLLSSCGIAITPLIASLGIGSLAIALALQPSLENLFAGIQILFDKPIQVGQFIKLDSGEQGYVAKVGWRSTWIRMLPNNVVVIPNMQIVSNKLVNYYYPEQEMAVLVQVGVHYDSDLEHVEKVTVDVGEETMKEVKGGVPEFKPFIRYHTFNDFSINFTVILRCKEFVDNYFIKHEFIKRLHKRYAKEGITIPFPINAINYSQEKAENK